MEHYIFFGMGAINQIKTIKGKGIANEAVQWKKS
jgi:hypothetical protein